MSPRFSRCSASLYSLLEPAGPAAACSVHGPPWAAGEPGAHCPRQGSMQQAGGAAGTVVAIGMACSAAAFRERGRLVGQSGTGPALRTDLHCVQRHHQVVDKVGGGGSLDPVVHHGKVLGAAHSAHSEGAHVRWALMRAGPAQRSAGSARAGPARAQLRREGIVTASVWSGHQADSPRPGPQSWGHRPAPQRGVRQCKCRPGLPRPALPSLCPFRVCAALPALPCTLPCPALPTWGMNSPSRKK